MKTFHRCVAAAALVSGFLSNARAETYELRGTGKLPDVGGSAVGIPGEEILVSVMLNSEDFQYVPVSNPVIHYFSPSQTIPVSIFGSISGEYEGVSPIARFVALELKDGPSGGDALKLDVAVGTAGTSLLSLSTSGASGFDGRVTPLSSEDLFSVFAAAMDDQGSWTPSSSSAVFVGADPTLLFLGQLQWTLINPSGGDLDGDGDVDGRDFLVWQRDSGSGSLTDWQSNYRTATPSTQAGSLIVPEPAAGLLLAVLACLFPMHRISLSRTAGRS